MPKSHYCRKLATALDVAYSTMKLYLPKDALSGKYGATLTAAASKSLTYKVFSNDNQADTLSRTCESDYSLSPLRPQSGETQKQLNRKTFNKRKEFRKNKSDKWHADLDKKLWTEKQRKEYFKTLYKPNAGTPPDEKTVYDTLTQELEELQKQAQALDFTLPEGMWNHLDAIVLVMYALSQASSKSQALSIVLLYLKTHYTDRNLLDVAFGFVKDLFKDDDLNPQAGFESPDWIETMRVALRNWRLVIGHPIFGKVSILLTGLVTLGLCDASHLEFRISDVKVFQPYIKEKHVGAVDLIDACIETVAFFVEAGYACIKTKSLTPLLYTDHRATEIENDYYFLIANLEHVRTGNLMKIAKMNDNDYGKKLEDTRTVLRDLWRDTKHIAEKRVYERKFEKLNSVKAAYESYRVGSGLRIAPFVTKIFGTTGVGKSTLSYITMNVVLKCNGACADDDRCVTLQDADAYMSTWRSDTNGVYFDDFGNTKSDFVQEAPTRRFIELCNNVPLYAVMAELELKGKIACEPLSAVVNTNIENLDAHKYSNLPSSVLRRCHIHVTSRVKKEFCKRTLNGYLQQQLDSEKVNAFYTNEAGIVDIPIFPDIWDIDVHECIQKSTSIKHDQDEYAFEPYVFEGKEMLRVDIKTYLRFLVERSRQHMKDQRALIARNKNLGDKIVLCDCGLPVDICVNNCVFKDPRKDDEEETIVLEPQAGPFGFVAGLALRQYVNQLWSDYVPDFRENAISLEKLTTKKLVKMSRSWEKSFWMNLLSLVPERWYERQWMLPVIRAVMKREVTSLTLRNTCFLAYASLLVCCMWFVLLPFELSCVISTVVLSINLLYLSVRKRHAAEQLANELDARREGLSEIFKARREKYVKWAMGALGTVGLCYSLFKVWQGFRAARYSTQGNLEPTTVEEIEERNKEKSPWAVVETVPIPTTDMQQCTSWKRMTDKIAKNTVHLTIDRGDHHIVVNGFFVKSNLCLVPHHIFFENSDIRNGKKYEEMSIVVQAGKKGCVGVQAQTILSWATTFHIPDTDLCLTYLPNCGSRADLQWLLPQDAIPKGQSHVVYRDANGVIQNSSACVEPDMVGHSGAMFEGAHTTLMIKTFSGLCMATYLSKSKPTCIQGFHLGGIDGTVNGCLGKLTQEQCFFAVQELVSRPGILDAASEGKMYKAQYGVEHIINNDVHIKCPSRYLTDRTHLDIFGTCIGKAKFYSKVVPTTISETVEDVCGVPQQWGPPKNMQSWKPWRESLQHLADPSIGMSGGLLREAFCDYTAPFKDLCKLHPETRPLTDMQNVCGIDGVRFIDKLKPQTAVGYPLSGPKDQYITRLDPVGYPKFVCPAELDPMFWDEVARCEQEYLAGRRCYPVFKASLKDEPTPLDKDKVRVFEAAPIAMQLLVRKYFLPLAALLSQHPITSENAVGINSEGPEWEQLVSHMEKFGKDRCFAGDYSKYDLRMSATLVLTAFEVLIKLAEDTGNYSEDDLKIMRGIATDVAYPIVAYNGTLMQLFGSNPSGQNLTVYINGICNSLLLRCFFYSLKSQHPDEGVAFRDVAAIETYGDDIKGTIQKGYDHLNIIAYAAFLKKYDMIFTMPDKKSEMVEFMHTDDADFLKRKNVFIPELNRTFGALDEKSIFKSLHSVLKSDAITADEAATINIDGARRAWFFHGRDIYESRRSQLQQIANRHNYVVPSLNTSFDEEVAHWKSRYPGH